MKSNLAIISHNKLTGIHAIKGHVKTMIGCCYHSNNKHIMHYKCFGKAGNSLLHLSREGLANLCVPMACLISTVINTKIINNFSSVIILSPWALSCSFIGLKNFQIRFANSRNNMHKTKLVAFCYFHGQFRQTDQSTKNWRICPSFQWSHKHFSDLSRAKTWWQLVQHAYIWIITVLLTIGM